MSERPTQKAGRGWEAYPEGRDGLEGPLGGFGGLVKVGRLSGRAGRGWQDHLEGREGSGVMRWAGRHPETLPKSRAGSRRPSEGQGWDVTPSRKAVKGLEGSGDPPGGLGAVGRQTRSAEGVWRPSQRSEMPTRRQAHKEVWGCLAGSPGGLGVVRRPSRRFGRGRETLPVDREGSAGPTGGPGGLGRSTWTAMSGREAHPVVLEGSGCPQRVSSGIGRSTQKAGRGQEGNPEVQEGSGGPPRGP